MTEGATAHVRETPQERVRRMGEGKPLVGATYHCVMLLGREDGTIVPSVQSRFCGFSEGRPRRELREGAPVRPKVMLELLRSIGEPGLLVNDDVDFYLYLLLGGHGVIERSLLLGHKDFARLIAPRETAYSYTEGYFFVDSAPKGMVTKAPSKKLRYQILKRDQFRCRVCGRSPAEDVHVTLEVHHINPFNAGGVTSINNLITLCDTCHDGAHDSVGGTRSRGVALELFPLIGVQPYTDLARNRPDYTEGVRLYREISRWVLHAAS